MKTDNSTISGALEEATGFRLPPALDVEFAEIAISRLPDNNELTAEIINDFFCNEYINNKTPFELLSINFEKQQISSGDEHLCCRAEICKNDSEHDHQGPHKVEGYGNGILDALTNTIKNNFKIDIEVTDYSQHSLAQGSHALAASYIQLVDSHGKSFWGVGIDSDSTLSAIRALISALNRKQLAFA